MSWSVAFRKTRKNNFDHYARAAGKSNFQTVGSIPSLIYGSFAHAKKSRKSDEKIAKMQKLNAKLCTPNAIDQRKCLSAWIPRISLCQIRLNVTSSIQNEVSCQRVHYTLCIDAGTFRSSTLPQGKHYLRKDPPQHDVSPCQ